MNYKYLGMVFIIIAIIVLIICYLFFRESLFEYPVKVPLRNGKTIDYINFDSAASTIPFKNILCKVNKFVPYYSNIHRGAGYCSALSTDMYETTKQRIMQFVNAPIDTSCIYTKNATESLNLLASICKEIFISQGPDAPRKKILITAMEHHSNILPWFKVAKDLKKLGYNITVEIVNINMATRCLDEMDLMKKLTNDVLIFSFIGASNVTGIRLPIKELTEKARRVGVPYICVDASQLIAHKKIDMEDLGIDALIFSAHKMYAPLGMGCLIAKDRMLSIPKEPTLLQGGGQVELVTNELDVNNERKIIWKKKCAKGLDEFYEAGTPNLLGAIALKVAIDELELLGLEFLEEHETSLYKTAYEGLKNLPEINIVSPNPEVMPAGYESGAVLSFYSSDLHYNLISTVLSNEFGIGTRAGCFCAHLYIEQTLGLSTENILATADRVESCDASTVPGFVRVSFAAYNTKEEVEKFIKAMQLITNKEIDLTEYQSANGRFSCPVTELNEKLKESVLNQC